MNSILLVVAELDLRERFRSAEIDDNEWIPEIVGSIQNIVPHDVAMSYT